MNKELLAAISALLDAASFALGPLDRHGGYESHPLDRQREPNDAITAHRCLKEAIANLEALLPEEVAA